LIALRVDCSCVCRICWHLAVSLASLASRLQQFNVHNNVLPTRVPHVY
jgi:hypothetical protein